MKVALLGLGTVGKAVYNIILKQATNIEVGYILVRNKSKYIDVSHLVTTDFNDILNDSSIDVVVEMMGASISYEYMKQALLAKKHVVTANKEVIANHYKELKEIAVNNNVKLLFEASVGGGIPIVHTFHTLYEDYIKRKRRKTQ